MVTEIVSKLLNTASSATHSLSIDNGGKLIAFNKAHLGVYEDVITIDLDPVDFGGSDSCAVTPLEKLTLLIAYIADCCCSDQNDIENSSQYLAILDVLRQYSGRDNLEIKIKTKYKDEWFGHLDHQLMESYHDIWDIINGNDEYKQKDGTDGGWDDWEPKYPNGTGLTIVDFIFNDGVRVDFGRD